ncbi:MAG TPA: serine/threonine-protein kinase [Kofleriaceae bacterium]
MSAAADSNPPGELYCTTCEKTFHVGDKCPTDGTRLLKLKARIDPFLGRELDGRYTVLEKLGQGGMGAVYRAQQHSIDREVAVKVVNSSLITDGEVIKRFLREAKIASKLEHPNVVGVLDFGQTDDGVFYIVMQLVSGRTLDQVLKSEKIIRPERVVRIGVQILEALAAAHEKQIVHRDLKPSNVMLLAQARDLVKVLDFGLAKSVAPDTTNTTMTGIGAVVGTPAFMPPELATGQPCDHRADLYSLGVMLYYMGSGRLPFISDSIHELVAMHGSDEPAPPMTGVPYRMGAVIDKLLQKDPNNRYQNAADALQALETSLLLTTPAHGIPYSDAAMTNPSLGPFPAQSEQFAAMHETPLPPSIVEKRRTAETESGRRQRSFTEEQRIAGGATMLATSQIAPVVATSGLDLSVKPKSKMPLFAGIGAVIAAAVIAFVVIGGGSKTTTTTTPKSDPPVKMEQDKAATKSDVKDEATPKPPEHPKVETPPVDKTIGSETPVGDKAGSGANVDDKGAAKTIKKTVKTNKTTKVGTGTTQQVKETPPGTGSGSAKAPTTKPPALPF